MKKILIVGAGIAGLSLARQLKKLAVPFTLIEKRSELTIEGAGIALPANAVKALRHIGIGKELDKLAHQVEEIIYAKSSGQILSRASLLTAPLNLDRFVALPRYRLLEILQHGLDVPIQFNTTLDQLKDVEDTYSTIVAADGIHSQVRQSAFGNIELIDFGVTTWRWICEYPTADLQPTYMFGRQDLLMAYPMGKNSVYCYAHAYDPENKYSIASDALNHVRRHFGDYQGVAADLLDRTRIDTPIIPGRLRSIPRAFFTKGNVALVGDASSACSPLLQQGAACALEDVIVLSELLAEFPNQKALAYYEQYRKERVNWILQTSDAPLYMLKKMRSPFFCFLRNILLRLKGPLNVQGWRKLLAADPIATLPAFVEANK